MAVETSYQRGDKFIRLITLFDLLQRSHQCRTTRELADELGTNIRNVQRDIAQIERAGLDIERDDHNRVRVGEGSKLPPLQFSKPEGVAVLIALRLLQQMRTSRDDALVGVVGRFAQAMRIDTVTAYLGAMLNATAELPEGGAREQIENVVVQCFVNRIPCEIKYQSYNGDVSQRVVRAYFLEPRPESRTICVYALDEKSRELRWFRVDRIQEARQVPIAGTYAVPEDFDIAEVTRSSWGIWQPGEALEEVVLLFKPAVAARVRETTWHEAAAITEQSDGALEMRLQVASEIEMRPWVLGWGSQVEVLAPASLRTFVADSMSEGVQMYDKHLSSG